MTLTPSDVASLSRSLVCWEVAEYVCAALVTIGCAGEYAAEFTNWFTGGITERKERLAKRSTLLLISALSLELICLVRTNNLSGREIALLNGVAEEEHLARVKIEHDAANRDITPEDQKMLSSRLSAFAGQRVDIDVFPVTFEHEWIAQTVLSVLVNADWNATHVTLLPAPPNHTLASNGTGVPAPFIVQGIWISATGDATSQSAATALFEALKSTVAPGSMDHTTLSNPKDPRVWIYVGDKPTPLRSWVK